MGNNRLRTDGGEGMSDQQLKIVLLEGLVEALLSVISEQDADNNVYTQWHHANAIRELLNHSKSNQ